MSQLPIEDVLPDLFAALSTHSQLILKAPPGAGKSTYLPLSLLQKKAFVGRIVMLEPRRLAAKNIAGFLARQLGEKVGETVGLRVRGETKVSANTKLEIVTEGVMTRMLQQDPELIGIDLLIFDEFHERSIHADTALALALEVQQALRDDLTVLVMSATLSQQELMTLLPEASYIESQGRCFPVEYRYSGTIESRDLIEKMAQAICQLLDNEKGSMLVFLPGVGEIKRLQQLLQERLDNKTLLCPLYGQLNIEQQQQAISAPTNGQRKVVLATNIAETSLTIEGIRLVVDSGLERIAQWDPKTGISRLQQIRIAQSSAEQRAGRAGRLEAGICLRMYSEEQLQRQPATPQPEILRSDLTSLAMELVQWGCNDPAELQWLDLPPAIALQQSRELLVQLGAIDSRGQQTERGQLIQSLGAEPRHAAILAFALELYREQSDATILSTAAMLIALLEDPPRAMDNPDLAFQLHLLESQKLTKAGHYRQRAIQTQQKLYQQLDIKLKSASLTVNNQWLGALLAAGFPDRIAMTRNYDGRYQLSNGQGVMLEVDLSLASEQTLVVADVVKTRQGDSRVFSAVAVDISQLQQVHPQLFTAQDWLDWDDKKGRLSAEHRVYCGKLIISRDIAPEPDPALASEALVNAIKRKGLSVLHWTDKAYSLLTRARCAAQWLPELNLPALDDESLLIAADTWLLPYMNGIKTMKGVAKVDVLAALEAYLGWDIKQQIDLLLPTHYQVPTGSNIVIRYHEQQQPVLAVKLQEMFGEKASPCIANGKVALVLELLSPAQRPLQITQDLAAFWQGSYKEVQKEMKGRYPKHPWPDDPANHIPTRKTKKYM
ncbi:ATP-dependent helicase HrpB [Photobacterium leiognathi]|uniref:ATP-dependent helicase HrpB n=1 Tax=Photobacterium leiognathi TaxID=553611 RepID=A0A2T3MD47_PHOLE|nr:ATP-dependent helicase HrpB [Photobacterium leiognathi]KJF99437.1 ATP-dependent helicase HrpB [Photobacterium leiognathi]PSV91377.1 ATP-dependent helicase HrpB [Photobacterium leiognathi]